ncbi:MAG: RluA family pseudouridine synthase, partial [Alphaproteobacteria bacterium]|nr:RluA family pseudouridine synthase [Alphaproteobacteria bacterium]
LAVQGGSKTTRHIDGLLDALKFDYDEKPRLVHRLDKETSGILVVARTAQSAGYFSKLFKSKDIHKTYWALVDGLPKPPKGKIEAPLIQKRTGAKTDTRTIDENGQEAVSLYAVQDHLADKVSWLQMSPLTGRTHQLRIHAAEVLKTPILGDDRYGKRSSLTDDLPDKMYLHARAISIPLMNKKELVVEAPLPKHFEKAFQLFGFSEKNVEPLFLRRQK